MDLNQEIQKQLNAAIANKVPQIIESKVESMLSKILEDIFSGYGDTAKNIKAQIETKLDVSLENLNLTDYNSMVAEKIADELNSQIDISPISKIIKNLVGKSNVKEISTERLCEMIGEVAAQDSLEQEGEISFHVRENDHYNWIEIAADLEEDKSWEECQIKVTINRKRGNIFTMKNDSYFNKGKVGVANRVNSSDLEALFFKLYNNQTKITNEETSFNKEWYKYEC